MEELDDGFDGDFVDEFDAFGKGDAHYNDDDFDEKEEGEEKGGDGNDYDVDEA